MKTLLSQAVWPLKANTAATQQSGQYRSIWQGLVMIDQVLNQPQSPCLIESPRCLHAHYFHSSPYNSCRHPVICCWAKCPQDSAGESWRRVITVPAQRQLRCLDKTRTGTVDKALYQMVLAMALKAPALKGLWPLVLQFPRRTVPHELFLWGLLA